MSESTEQKFTKNELPGGEIFIGKLINNKKTGLGQLLTSVGVKFMGEWQKNTITGLGVRISNSGEVYFGELISCIKQGLGRLHRQTGVHYAQFEDGELTEDLSNDPASVEKIDALIDAFFANWRRFEAECDENGVEGFKWLENEFDDTVKFTRVSKDGEEDLEVSEGGADAADGPGNDFGGGRGDLVQVEDGSAGDPLTQKVELLGDNDVGDDGYDGYNGPEGDFDEEEEDYSEEGEEEFEEEIDSEDEYDETYDDNGDDSALQASSSYSPDVKIRQLRGNPKKRKFGRFKPKTSNQYQNSAGKNKKSYKRLEMKQALKNRRLKSSKKGSKKQPGKPAQNTQNNKKYSLADEDEDLADQKGFSRKLHQKNVDKSIAKNQKKFKRRRKKKKKKSNFTGKTLLNGDKIVRKPVNVKKAHRVAVKDPKGRTKYEPEPGYESGTQAAPELLDGEDVLLFNEPELGLGLDEYADELEMEKRVEQYYKSYLDRMMREDPKDWDERMPNLFACWKNGKKKGLLAEDTSRLWRRFIGDYVSGRIYFPNERRPRYFDDLPPEQKLLYLFSTDYKPFFAYYVQNRKYKSTGQKAKEFLNSRSKEGSREGSKEPRSPNLGDEGDGEGRLNELDSEAVERYLEAEEKRKRPGKKGKRSGKGKKKQLEYFSDEEDDDAKRSKNDKKQLRNTDNGSLEPRRRPKGARIQPGTGSRDGSKGKKKVTFKIGDGSREPYLDTGSADGDYIIDAEESPPPNPKKSPYGTSKRFDTLFNKSQFEKKRAQLKRRKEIAAIHRHYLRNNQLVPKDMVNTNRWHAQNSERLDKTTRSRSKEKKKRRNRMQVKYLKSSGSKSSLLAESDLPPGKVRNSSVTRWGDYEQVVAEYEIEKSFEEAYCQTEYRKRELELEADPERVFNKRMGRYDFDSTKKRYKKVKVDKHSLSKNLENSTYDNICNSRTPYHTGGGGISLIGSAGDVWKNKYGDNSANLRSTVKRGGKRRRAGNGARTRSKESSKGRHLAGALNVSDFNERLKIRMKREKKVEQMLAFNRCRADILRKQRGENEEVEVKRRGLGRARKKKEATWVP